MHPQRNGKLAEDSYYLTDEQGSIRYVLDSDGKIQNTYQYGAFGEPILAEESTPNRLRYNAQIEDDLNSLYYLRARYYNPITGRFTQEDVIYNDGLNLYAYCNSNPVMYCDPSGLARKPAPVTPEDEIVQQVLFDVTGGTNIIPGKDGFQSWFNGLSETELSILYSDPITKGKITSGLRGDNYMHEWFKVSQAPKFKEWGVTAEEIMSAVTPTQQVRFYQIATKNGVLDGYHGNKTASVSSMAHLQLDELIESSSSKEEYISKLKNWADTHLGIEVDGKTIKGADALPSYFHEDGEGSCSKKG